MGGGGEHIKGDRTAHPAPGSSRAEITKVNATPKRRIKTLEKRMLCLSLCVFVCVCVCSGRRVEAWQCWGLFKQLERLLLILLLHTPSTAAPTAFEKLQIELSQS